MSFVRRLSRAGLFACAATLAIASYARADVTISTDATANMSCSGGVCSPTASDAVLNVTDLDNLLASGSVEVTTTGSGVQANNIDVTAPFSWSSANVLILDAYQSIAVGAAVSVAGLSGLTLTTNDDGSGGVLSFGSGGNVTFANLSSALTINGVSYTLVDTIQSLATAITANPSGDYAFAGPYDAKNDGTYKAVPISTTFTSTFEGLGNTISNFKLRQTASSNIGLFADLGQTGTIRDINLAHSKVLTIGGDGTATVGLLLGGNEGALIGCFAGGSVLSNKIPKDFGEYSGGLVGLNQGTITNSSSAATVTADGYGFYGGLAGFSSGTITNSYATGNVSGGHIAGVGGLVGYLYGTSTISATIDVAFATGSVTGSNSGRVGGLVGQTDEESQISNSYATGSVSVGRDVGRYYAFAGGLIGAANYTGVFSTSYSTGPALSQGEAPKCGGKLGKTCVGGSMGWNGSNSVSDIYWDTSLSKNTNATGNNEDNGINGLTTKQLKSGLPSGFDPSIWGQQGGFNHGFPYLLAIPPK